MNQRFILKSVLNRNTWNKVNILISWQNYCEEAHRNLCLQILTVQFSHSVVSDSLRPHGLQHTRPPCSSLTPGVYSNLCPLSRWCHPTVLSSVVPFFSCHQSSPASGSFQMSQFFASGGQSIGVSTSASVQSLTGSTISICFFDSSHFPCTTLVSLHHILPWFEGGFYFLSDIMSSWRTGTVFS